MIYRIARKYGVTYYAALFEEAFAAGCSGWTDAACTAGTGANLPCVKPNAAATAMNATKAAPKFFLDMLTSINLPSPVFGSAGRP